jgi:hypothetical protein
MNRGIYCGNNLFEVGNRRIGTSYECLRKGIGQGLNADISSFNPNYQAIIADNTYCGTGPLPDGKQMGTPTSCLRKGVGVGMKLQYERSGGGGGRGRGRGRLYILSECVLKWWPLILALLVGALTIVFRAKYTTIILTMIAVFLVSWFTQSMMNRHIIFES